MKYVVDSEFIDTPECSALISLAIVREDGESLYYEFDYPESKLTPWLRENVVPHLTGCRASFEVAAGEIAQFIGDDKPEFWCYFGAYDWYWFCRLFGGFMELPEHWGIVAYHDFAHIQRGVPNTGAAEHNALDDAHSLLDAMRAKGLVPTGITGGNDG